MLILLCSVSVIGLNDIDTFESDTLHNIKSLMWSRTRNRYSEINFLKIESISMTDLRIESLRTNHRINLGPKNSKTSFAV